MAVNLFCILHADMRTSAVLWSKSHHLGTSVDGVILEERVVSLTWLVMYF